MLCAISGETPQEPVASRKSGKSMKLDRSYRTLTHRSGNVFEKRLIEAYIAENGKDPVTGEELAVDDLVGLKSARVVRPRPPTLTSIPSLLSIFQNEWDALALETFTLRRQLAQTRQELSTALYQHDAAVRVIARLTRERDESREALSKITINAGGTVGNGDEMQIDSHGLPEAIAAKIDSTQEKLSKSRRKRPIPQDWADSEIIQSFTTIETSEALYPGSKSIAIDISGDLALVGGTDGIAGLYSISQKRLVQVLNGGDGAIIDMTWWGNRAVFSTSSGTVKIFDVNGAGVASFNSHAGEVTALALHPSGEILASVGVDKSYVLYDLSSLKPVSQVFTDSGLSAAGFHPDGHLFAAGGEDGQIKIFNVNSGTSAANFDSAGPIQALSFSENGTWLAAVVRGQTSVTIWDLRKAAQTKVLELGSNVHSIRWDYTGQFLAAVGPSGISVQQYTRSTKEWSEPFRSAVSAVAVQWGPRARSLISVGAAGVVTVLGSQ
ncbi:hypothetical protein FGG08_000238 [Glutinoglossum americanum]|uniref:Pre-mRNA-processing factor 19 n=1 Tax=Glutinoglossum americanum TaxID=1670608 RepID=A0A9P8I9E9_9PEZI|nr:hypothetical protein FGG08_000238 [Glutinoglossum americanum]